MTQGTGNGTFTRGFLDSYEAQQHADDHAALLGLSTVQEYVAAADEFLGAIRRRGVRECVRPRGRYAGDIVRWDAATGEFGVLRADRIIKTYFKLDLQQYRHLYATDEDYFKAQCKKT